VSATVNFFRRLMLYLPRKRVGTVQSLKKKMTLYQCLRK
jgi:hypothetical protein